MPKGGSSLPYSTLFECPRLFAPFDVRCSIAQVGNSREVFANAPKFTLQRCEENKGLLTLTLGLTEHECDVGVETLVVTSNGMCVLFRKGEENNSELFCCPVGVPDPLKCCASETRGASLDAVAKAAQKEENDRGAVVKELFASGINKVLERLGAPSSLVDKAGLCGVVQTDEKRVLLFVAHLKISSKELGEGFCQKFGNKKFESVKFVEIHELTKPTRQFQLIPSSEACVVVGSRFLWNNYVPVTVENDDECAWPEDEAISPEERKKTLNMLQYYPRSLFRSMVRGCFYPARDRAFAHQCGLDEGSTILLMKFGKGARYGCCCAWLSFDWFDVMVSIAIFLNMIVLGAYDPIDAGNPRNVFLDYCDDALTLFFLFEVFVLWVSFGTRYYFSDGWQIVDFFVVVGSVISSVLQRSGVGSGSKGLVLLRSIRMLRPFKSMTRFKSVQLLTGSLFQSFKGMVDITILFLLFLAVFGIGLSLHYRRRLRTRCVSLDYYNSTIYSQFSLMRNLTGVENYLCGGQYDSLVGRVPVFGCTPAQTCDDEESLMYKGYRCPWGYICRDIDLNPLFGFANFDNTAVSMFTLFVMTTLEGWSFVMYDLLDATGFLSGPICIVLVLIGSFFILRLAIVLITVAFQEVHEEQQREKTLARERRERERSVFKQAPILKKDKKRYRFEVFFRNVRVWVSSRILQQRRFTVTVPVLIALNIIILATDHYGMSQGMETVQTISNIFFTIVYTVELVLRVLGTRWHEYYTDPLNIFDVVIVLISWIDLFLSSMHVPFIRGLRALRIVKLLKSVPSVYLWITVIIKCIKGSLALVLLISIFIFVFACIGMQLFGGAFCGMDPEVSDEAWCQGLPRSNFDTWADAMFTCFQILTGDNWNEVMYTGMRAKGEIYAAFFVVLYYFGNNVLVNILIGILLTARASITRENEDNLVTVTANADNLEDSDDDKGVPLLKLQFEIEEMLEKTENELTEIQEKESAKNKKKAEEKKVEERVLTRDELLSFKLEEIPFLPFVDDSDEDEDTAAQIVTGAQRCKSEKDRLRRETRSVGEPKSKWRVKIREIVDTTFFESFLLLTIVVNTVAMGLENPIAAPDTTPARAMWWCDVVTTGIFAFEWIAKSIAYGWGLTKSCYLGRSHWNQIDFCLVWVGAIGLLEPVISQVTGDLPDAVMAFTSLRALRPLRVIKRSPALSTVVHALLYSFVPVSRILVIGMLLFVVWGLMGVQLFKGAFYRCDVDVSLDRFDCSAAGGRWVNEEMNFDHIGVALTSLWVLTSLDGWPEVMYDGIDSVGVGMAPRRNNRRAASLYFLLFVVLSGFFVVNLFTSVLIDVYEQSREQTGGHSFTTAEQNAWIEANKRILRALPRQRPRAGTCRLRMWDAVNSAYFEWAINFCIIVNVIVMSLDKYPEDTSGAVVVINLLNNVFLGVYVVEAALKNFAMRRDYWRHSWNVFDFIVMAVGLLAAIVEFFLERKNVIATLRALRVLRILRLLKSMPNLRRIMNSFWLCLPPLFNVVGLMLLVFYIFSIMGMKLFGRVKRNGALMRHCNFESLSVSLMTLLRVATGGDTPDILGAYKIEEPGCLNRIGECGLPAGSQIFFGSFSMISALILLNMFTAVIVESFRALDTKGCLRISQEHADCFARRWAVYDKHWNLKIRSVHLLPMLNSVPLTNPLSVQFHLGTMFHRGRYGEIRFLKALGVQENAQGEVALPHVTCALARLSHEKAAITSVRENLERKFGSLTSVKTELFDRPAYRRIAANKVWQCWRENKMHYIYTAAPRKRAEIFTDPKKLFGFNEL